MRRGFTLTEMLVSIAIILVVMTVLLAVLEATFRTLRIVSGETNAQERARLAMRYVTKAIEEANTFTQVMHPDLLRPDTRAGYEAALTAGGSCAASGTPVAAAPVPDARLWRQDIDASCLIEPGEVGTDPDLTFSETFTQGVGVVPGLCSDAFYRLANVLAEPDANTATADSLADRNQNPDHPTETSSVLESLLNDGAVSLPAWLSPDHCGYAPYQTALEDLNGDGAFSPGPIESRLRTLVFGTVAPVYAMGEGSHVPANPDDVIGLGDQREQVERRIVTLAHTWKEKVFLMPYSERMSLACDPEENNHLVTDFVLYQRITRLYSDPWVNTDIDQDGATGGALGRDVEDECLRTVETPLVTGVADVQFRLFDAEGDEINPGDNSYFNPQGFPLGGTYYWTTRASDEPFSSLPFVTRVEVSVWGASDDVIDVLRRTRGRPATTPATLPFVTDVIFQNIQAGDPQEVGRVDFLGIVQAASGRRLYNPANFIQLRETVDLRFWGGV